MVKNLVLCLECFEVNLIIVNIVGMYFWVYCYFFFFFKKIEVLNVEVRWFVIFVYVVSIK